MTPSSGNEKNEAVRNEIIKCPKCAAKLSNDAKFCFICGEKIKHVSENEMICPVCGNKTPKGKFCMECGSSLQKKCTKCGSDIPTGGKFCLECGEKV